MTLEADSLAERRRLKRRVSFWRTGAIILAVIAIGAYLATRQENFLAQFGLNPHVARISITGFISDDRKQRELLTEIGENEQVRGVILYIDSPGGTTSGAETLYNSLRELAAKKPVVLNGIDGLSQKSADAGNASYYYSITRLQTDGTVHIGDEAYAVSGLSWLDREWGSSALSAQQEGWDWFALHLSDGSSLMFYRLRAEDGSATRFSSGSWVRADGTRRRLGPTDVTLAVLDEWTSGATGVRYPVAWRLAVPEEGISLDIKPYLEQQELELSVRYWEGAVRAEGEGPAGALTGQGYLELAGY